MGDISKERKFAIMVNIDKSLGDLLNFRLSNARLEIEKISSELGVNVSNKIRNIIENAYYNDFSLKLGEIYKVIRFVKEVYISIFGNVDGFEKYLENNSVLLCTNYAQVQFRTAIFNHFGLLKEVFINDAELLTNSYTMVTTKDFYRILYLRSINTIEEFKEFALRVSPNNLNKMRKSCEVNREMMLQFYSELMDDLKSLKRKNKFLYMMRRD